MEQKPGVTRSGNCRTKAKPDWQSLEEETQSAKHAQGQRLLRNIMVAALLVVCAALLRTGGVWVSGPDAVLTAASGGSLLDEQLGKLSFVSAIFPQATLVFGESSEGVLTMPVMSASLTHAWSGSEPYMAWHAEAQDVTACMAGEVRGVYHGNGEELMVQLGADTGLVCTYGGLAEVFVHDGDAVHPGDVIGRLADGASLAFEVRQGGRSVDPAKLLPGAS